MASSELSAHVAALYRAIYAVVRRIPRGIFVGILAQGQVVDLDLALDEQRAQLAVERGPHLAELLDRHAHAHRVDLLRSGKRADDDRHRSFTRAPFTGLLDHLAAEHARPGIAVRIDRLASDGAGPRCGTARSLDTDAGASSAV